MKPVLEAHRGVGTEAPENTLAAFKLAVKQGYGMIELDPKFTVDGHCVILHDSTVNRTGRLQSGEPYPTPDTRIASLTLSEARELDFGVWFAPEFAGEPIPTLTEVLNFAREAKIPLKFDNVIEYFTAKELDTFYSELAAEDLKGLVGITAKSVDFIKAAIKRIPWLHIHFDGAPTEENLEALAKLLPKEQLTVWLCHSNPHTAWCKTPPLTRERAELVRKYATVGIWILFNEAELSDALSIAAPDYIETNGALKP